MTDRRSVCFLCESKHMDTHTHTHTHTHKRNLSHNYTAASPRLSFLSSVFSGLFLSSAHDALWHNEAVKRSPVQRLRPRGGGEGVGGCKVTPHQGTIFTTCLFNTRPIYSCQIFSQRLQHTVAPSQTQASDGTAGFTLRCAAKGNTPYPPAFSCAHLPSLQQPSTLHNSHIQDIHSSSHCVCECVCVCVCVCALSPLSFLLSHWSNDERGEEGLTPVSVVAWLGY